MKKYLPFILIFVAVLIGSIFLILRLVRSNQAPAEEELSEVEISQAPLSERPYVSLVPRSDGHEFKLVIKKIKNVKVIDYEMVYLVNDLQRGVIGTIETSGKTEVSKDLLLGSCSKNVCKYDEGVTEGILTLRLRTTEGTVKYEAPFNLHKAVNVKDVIATDQGTFQYNGGLTKGVWYIVMKTIGLPANFDKNVILGPYGIFMSDNGLPAGTVTIKPESDQTGILSGWNSKTNTWTVLESQPVSNLQAFVLAN